VAGRCEHGNEASDFMKSWNFLDSRRNYWLPQEHFLFMESVIYTEIYG